MNRERWKNTWGELKGNIEHYLGHLNDETFKSLGAAGGGIYQRVRAMFGPKAKADASNATPGLAGKPLQVDPSEPNGDLHRVQGGRPSSN